MSRPTMNDVARTAGVSLKTVSRVVNGEPTVTPDLAARVRAAVETLDYRPHLGASLLRRNDRRTRMIGVLLEDVSNPFSGVLHRAIEEEAHARGVHVLTGSLGEDERRERELARAFRQRQTDGLIIAPTGSDQTYLSRFTGTPIVFVDRQPSGFLADTVVSTNVAGAAVAVRHLAAHGHRRIAFLGDNQRIPTARERFRGYLQALGHRPGPVVHELRGEAAAERATIALLRRADPPTALFTSQNLITIGAVRALRRLDRHRSVALVGFDDFPLADLLEPAVTVVAQHPARIGRVAAGALFERIDGHDGPPREIRVATTLIARGSGEIFATGN
ncbi:LacI family transcriptional regulator [Actinoplanes lutulentus]|uniref:LacI family transcriptional regulator n=1 Tax=Actinoplanes lutulentus TaxID=1287878 RepID=A0A327ZGX5_9ACTN|nr:LacI family DNA-binding transcriptional regulator [Actinoplanes lutulentus]MBB2945214.1 LacI family transcriptional regulator [Actinoplanes lutulentus]RAK40650.1 LacI family transcriptional regulator [Actinoplanes lutulentus]